MSWDINKICRTCLTNSKPTISIFNGANTPCLSDLLNLFTTINPKLDDQMPKWMCLSCVREINRCYAFKMKCENSNNNLLQLLRNSDGAEETVCEVPTRIGEGCVANDIDEFKKEPIADTVQEIEEFVHDPEDLMQETVPKSNEMYDPLEGDSNIFKSRDFQDIELINAVKQHQCLYNTDLKDYKSFPKRRRAWQQISKAVRMPEKACQSRWRDLRDHFVRLTKAASTSTLGEKNCRFKKNYQWPLLKYLEFLSEHVKWKGVEVEYDPALGVAVLVSSKQEFNIKLAHEVQKCKCLYERHSRDHDNIKARLKAWEEIGTKMNLPGKY